MEWTVAANTFVFFWILMAWLAVAKLLNGDNLSIIIGVVCITVVYIVGVVI